MTNFANDAPLYFARVLRNSGNKPMRCRDILVRACIDGLDAAGVPDAEAAADRLLTESDMFAAVEPGYFMMDDRDVVRFPIISVIKEQLVDPTISLVTEQPNAVETKTVRFPIIPAKKEAPAVETESVESLFETVKEIPEIVIEDKKPVGDLTPSEQQGNIVHWAKFGKGNAIVEALAGTGKTAMLMMVARVIYETTCMIAYNKRAAVELEERVKKDPNLSNRTFGEDHIETGTIHSKGLQIGLRCGDLPRNVEIIKEKNGKLHGIVDAEVRAKRIPESYADCVVSTVAMAKEMGFVDEATAGYWSKFLPSIDDVSKWIDTIYLYDTDQGFKGEGRDFDIEALVRYSQIVLRKSNADLTKCDFADMVYLPVLYAKTWVPKHKRSWICLDEAQDASPVRMILAAILMKKGARFIAVGDRKQSIYHFSGASSKAFDDLKEIFNIETVFPLSKSFRCPRRIIKLAQTIVPEIEPVDTAPEGRLIKMTYDDMVASFAKMDKSQYKHIAVLCRFNRHLTALCFQLIREGVAAKVEGRDIGKGLVTLARRWKVSTTAELRDRLNAFRDREVEKAKNDGRGNAATNVDDKVLTLLTIIANTEDRKPAGEVATVDDVVDTINEIFDDMSATDKNGKKKNPNVVTLTTIHKAKGLEWPLVLHLGRKELMPAPMAMHKPETAIQEDHLEYVSITRGKQIYGDIERVPEIKSPDIKPL